MGKFYTQLLAVRDNKINIAVGKYMSLIDSYKSLSEALFCAGAHIGTTVNVDYIDSEKITRKKRARYVGRTRCHFDTRRLWCAWL